MFKKALVEKNINRCAYNILYQKYQTDLEARCIEDSGKNYSTKYLKFLSFLQIHYTYLPPFIITFCFLHYVAFNSSKDKFLTSLKINTSFVPASSTRTIR